MSHRSIQFTQVANGYIVGPIEARVSSGNVLFVFNTMDEMFDHLRKLFVDFEEEEKEKSAKSKRSK